jgi:hypothetical protein
MGAEARKPGADLSERFEGNSSLGNHPDGENQTRKTMKSKFAVFINRIFHNQEVLFFVPIYFFLSLTNLVLKLRLTPEWTDGTLDGVHNWLMAFQYSNNEQSRLFQFLIPEAFHRLFSLTVGSSYALARLLFVFMAFVAFHFFLRKWFSRSESFAGVLILSGSMAITFLIFDLQESAPLLMLLFILGLWALREKKDLLFGLLLLLGGGLTNETMLVMSAGYFFYRVSAFKIPNIFKTGFKTILIALPAFLVQGGIRYITRHQPHLAGAFHLPDNITGIWEEIRDPVGSIFNGKYLYPFLIFSIFWIYAAVGYRRSPHFLKAVFWLVPLFVTGNLITGIITESRQMIPLGFILIPMSLFLIFPREPDPPGIT